MSRMYSALKRCTIALFPRAKLMSCHHGSQITFLNSSHSKIGLGLSFERTHEFSSIPVIEECGVLGLGIACPREHHSEVQYQNTALHRDMPLSRFALEAVQYPVKSLNNTKVLQALIESLYQRDVDKSLMWNCFWRNIMASG